VSVLSAARSLGARYSRARSLDKRRLPADARALAGGAAPARGVLLQATAAERLAILELLDRAKAMLDAEYAPDGYNIGINDGAAAGQTVMHLHVHLIPRYKGDMDDPRGGGRWIFARKAAYWDK
jgi:hypothetical protein